MGLESYKKMIGEDNNYDELKKEYDNHIKFYERASEKDDMVSEYARNMPNTIEGFKAGIKGGGIGAGAGAVGGAIIGGFIGGATSGGTGTGAGALAGAKVGAKWLGGAGYVAGQSQYTYELEAGLQYQTLLEMGVPDDIAKKEAKRVGKTNALIESGESIIDLATLGKFSAGKELLKQGLVKKYGMEKVSKWVGTSALQNVVTEGAQEGLQEKVAIDSEIRATDEAGIERDASGDKERIIDSIKAGAFSSLITGGGMYIASKGASKGTQKVIDYSNNKKIDSVVNDQISKYEAKTGMTLDDNQRNEIRNEVITQLKQENKQPTNINTQPLSEEEQALTQQHIQQLLRQL